MTDGILLRESLREPDLDNSFTQHGRSLWSFERCTVFTVFYLFFTWIYLIIIEFSLGGWSSARFEIDCDISYDGFDEICRFFRQCARFHHPCSNISGGSHVQ